jgi:glycosyltransferase involved in cell wall biosynthesis
MAESARDATVRVLHFVTGGFSGGATQVAAALCETPNTHSAIEPLLVLRRKRHTDPKRIEALRARGIRVEVVPGWSHFASILALVRLCRRFRPQVLVAHGFSEHLWGRYAGLIAKVPVLVQVEHNTRERYTAFRLAQSRWLARRTARIVGCSEGVRAVLLAQGLPADRCVAISNGIRTEPFAPSPDRSFTTREAGVVMVARFSKQKDHATLLRALVVLRERGLHPQLHLAGGGKSLHRRPVELLAQRLGLTEQVRFLGVIDTVPTLLMSQQVCVLSTHYEGMPLALIEGMAAGCAVVGSRVPGVQEIIRHGEDGLLVDPGSPLALADALELLLRDPARAAGIATAGRTRALAEFSRERMQSDYAKLLLSLAGDPGQLPQGVQSSGPVR